MSDDPRGDGRIAPRLAPRPGQRFTRPNRIAQPAPPVAGLPGLPGQAPPGEEEDFSDIWPDVGGECVTCGGQQGCHLPDCPDGILAVAVFMADANRNAARRRWLGPDYDPVQTCLDTAQQYSEIGQSDLAAYWLAVAETARQIITLHAPTTPPPPLPPCGETALAYLERHREIVTEVPTTKLKAKISFPRKAQPGPTLFKGESDG